MENKHTSFKSGIKINTERFREIVSGIRNYLAEILLNLSFSVSTSDEKGEKLKQSIIEYFKSCPK